MITNKIRAFVAILLCILIVFSAFAGAISFAQAQTTSEDLPITATEHFPMGEPTDPTLPIILGAVALVAVIVLFIITRKKD